MARVGARRGCGDARKLAKAAPSGCGRGLGWILCAEARGRPRVRSHPNFRKPPGLLAACCAHDDQNEANRPGQAPFLNSARQLLPLQASAQQLTPAIYTPICGS